MTKHKIESFHSLIGEMRAVAKGEKPAPKASGPVRLNSAEAVVRLLTTENRQLLAIIRDKAPQSIQELSELTGRAQPNLTRTLGKLEAMGACALWLRVCRRVRGWPGIVRLVGRWLGCGLGERRHRQREHGNQHQRQQFHGHSTIGGNVGTPDSQGR